MRVCPKCFAQESEDARFCGLCGTKLFEVQAGENTSLVGLVLKDKYTIQKRIAVGGMGEVYLATHREIGQKVAVKILNKRFQGNETVVKRFVNEARSYTLVTHPNAVKLYDFGQLDDGTFFIIMEFVQGQTLTQHLADSGPLEHRHLLNLAHQLAEVLLAAHAQMVVHRDLKPDNLMLQEPSPGRYQLKVLDFGIAKLVDDSAGQLTEAGMVFGTPEFMSPEQAQGLEVDNRTDIYAFGMLLYYMAAYRLPFDGLNKLSILNKQVHDRPALPSEMAPDVDIDPGLEALIMTCLRKAPEDRYSSFEDVLSDLELIIANRPPKLARTDYPGGNDTLPDYISLDDEPRGNNAATVNYSAANHRSTAETVNVGRDPLQEMFDRAPISGDEITIVASPDSDPELAVIAQNAVAERELELDEEITKIEASRPSAADDGFRFGSDEPDSGAFTLGDDLSVDHDEMMASYGRKRGGGGALGLLIGLLVIGAIVGVWLTMRSGESTSEADDDTERKPVVATPDVIEEVAAPDTQQAVTAETDVSDAPSAPQPLPASSAIDHQVRVGAVLRVLLDDATKGLQEGKLSDAQKLLKKAEKLGDAPAAHGKRRAELKERISQAEELLSQGKRMASRLRCSEVAGKAIELQELSPGAATTLTELVTRCKRQLAAPPSQVD